MMYDEYDTLPEGILDCHAGELHTVLNGPSLIHLPGRDSAPLFVSVLLHGNEDTSWDAVRGLLHHYQGQTLPRALSIFIGNVAAARLGVRHLEGQPDYNRVWGQGNSPEHRMMAAVVETMRRRQVFASIDVHNNTGINPHYACINKLDARFIHMAMLFSRTLVYFITPDGVQSLAMSKVCPAVTIECGKPGQEYGTEHAREFIDAVMHLDHFPSHDPLPQDFDLYHTVAIVKIPEAIEFGFGPQQAPLNFPQDLDHLNFRELKARTPIASVSDAGIRLHAWSEEGEDLAERYFENNGECIVTRLPVMPSMLTLNQEVIRQDCLCYLMERMSSRLDTVPQ